MRRLLPVLAFLVWAAPANAEPTVAIQPSATAGQAPFAVTLTAVGDGVSYDWDLGDGSQADGPVVQHTYRPGRFTATVTARGADGMTAQASVTITSIRLTLTGPRVATYGRTTSFRGRLIPTMPGTRVALYGGETALRSARPDKQGRFRFRIRPHAQTAYTARIDSVTSNAVAVAVRPALDVSLPPMRMLGRRLVLHAKLKPRGSGSLSIRVWRSGKALRARTFGDQATIRLSTNRIAEYVVRIAVSPSGSFTGRKKTFRSSVFVPYLSQGAQGPSVRILERRLAELHYALRGVDTYFSYDTADAVLAFQKVHGIARTARVNPSFWRRLQSAHIPRTRYRGPAHFEVDKTRQVLFQAGPNGHVIRVVHVSTGATGNTPVGRWHIYSRVPGTLPTGMYDSSFFLRGFAIHGYPSVPPYPASHGCVRIPMWVASTVFAASFYGETVYVYS
jgi:PKD repeat protein